MTYDEKKEVVFKYLINKMLRPHGVNYDYVVEHQEIDGEPWFCHYQWTMKEQEEFGKEAIPYIKKILKVPTIRAEQITAMFILGHGLKCSDYPIQKTSSD